MFLQFSYDMEWHTHKEGFARNLYRGEKSLRFRSDRSECHLGSADLCETWKIFSRDTASAKKPIFSM